MIGEYVKFKRKVSQIQMKMLENISKFWINFGKKKIYVPQCHEKGLYQYQVTMIR